MSTYNWRKKLAEDGETMNDQREFKRIKDEEYLTYGRMQTERFRLSEYPTCRLVQMQYFNAVHEVPYRTKLDNLTYFCRIKTMRKSLLRNETDVYLEYGGARHHFWTRKVIKDKSLLSFNYDVGNYKYESELHRILEELFDVKATISHEKNIIIREIFGLLKESRKTGQPIQSSECTGCSDPAGTARFLNNLSIYFDFTIAQCLDEVETRGDIVPLPIAIGINCMIDCIIDAKGPSSCFGKFFNKDNPNYYMFSGSLKNRAQAVKSIINERINTLRNKISEKHHWDWNTAALTAFIKKELIGEIPDSFVSRLPSTKYNLDKSQQESNERFIFPLHPTSLLPPQKIMEEYKNRNKKIIDAAPNPQFYWDSLENLASKLGLNLDYVNSSEKEWIEDGYYPDLVSYFLAVWGHRLSGTEVIDASVNISKILQNLRFNKKTADYLQSVILEDTLDLSLSHWINCYVSEKLVDAETVDGWMREQGEKQIGVAFHQTIKTRQGHFEGPDVNKVLRCTWVEKAMLKTKIPYQEGLKSDKYWYHSTTAHSALSILQVGIKCERNLTDLLHLGPGFYLSNNHKSVNRYINRSLRFSEIPVGVVLVFNLKKLADPTSFDAKRLCVASDMARTKKIVHYFKNRNRNTNPNEERDGLPPDFRERYSAIVARDTGDGNNEWYAGAINHNQMCIRKDEAANALMGCLQEIWLVKKPIAKPQESKDQDLEEREREIVTIAKWLIWMALVVLVVAGLWFWFFGNFEMYKIYYIK